MFFLFLILCARYIVIIITYQIEIWKCIIIVFLVYFIRRIYIYKTEKSKMNHNFIKSGLKWDVLIKKNKCVSIDGPSCPNCECSISESDLAKDGALQCLKCGNKYNLNGVNTLHLKEDIKKIIDSDLRLGKILMIDWYAYDYPNSHLKVTNKGTFS